MFDWLNDKMQEKGNPIWPNYKKMCEFEKVLDSGKAVPKPDLDRVVVSIRAQAELLATMTGPFEHQFRKKSNDIIRWISSVEEELSDSSKFAASDGYYRKVNARATDD